MNKTNHKSTQNKLYACLHVKICELQVVFSVSSKRGYKEIIPTHILSSSNYCYSVQQVT